MEQLIALLKDKVGLSEDMAKQAADVALTFVKEKLPDGIGEHVDTLIAGGDIGDIVSDKLGGLAGGLGGIGDLLGGSDDEA